ncbi:MAG: RNA methyltransferase [Lysobacterales bacterium]
MTSDRATIRFVLARPAVAGNIGAAARAIKTMGHSELWLVAPQTPFPHRDAAVRAVEAIDVLNSAQVVDTLDEALVDCQLTVGISARQRQADWPLYSPPELAEVVADIRGPVALVFGTESSGLSNEELYQCRAQSLIASNPDCPSLNLSHAVQIYAWQLAQEVRPPSTGRTDRPTQQQLDHLQLQISRLIDRLDFAPASPDDPRLSAILNRADLKRADWSLLEGVIQRALDRLPE